MRKVDILRKRLSHISFYSIYYGIIFKDKVGGKEENEIINRICKRLTKNQLRRIVEINRFYLNECEYAIVVTIIGNTEAFFMEV